jgi:hypothetical protein
LAFGVFFHKKLPKNKLLVSHSSVSFNRMFFFWGKQHTLGP